MRRLGHRCAVVAAGAVAGTAVFAVASAGAATQTFSFTGAEQTFTVPSGVTSLHVVAIGANGGLGDNDGGGNSGGPGGFGARVEANLAVTPGEVLFIEVGGTGADGTGGGGGGFNGGGSSNLGDFHLAGGGGGGATDARTCSRSSASCSGTTLGSRLLVAAGGGGGGMDGHMDKLAGGEGGNAAADGKDGQSMDCSTLSPASTPGGGGKAGSQVAGGTGGTAGNDEAPAGNPGALGQGGAAGTGGSNSEPGGGGGGGLYGGGAGGAANGCAGAGGGGGSSLVPAGGNAMVGAAGASPQLQITYTPPTTDNGPSAPALVSNASESNAAFAVSSKPKLVTTARRHPHVGTTFSYTLDRTATVRFDFTQPGPGRKVNTRCVTPNRRNKRKHKCIRTVIRGSLSFAGHVGVNTVKFYGWLSRHRKLKPGKYTLVITATTPGAGSTSQKLKFTIVR